MLTEEQRKKRKNGIGASDSAIIMGYSSFKTPYQLYLEKLGLVDEEEEETELQFWGNKIEPILLERFANKHQVEVICPDTIYHPEYPFIFANLDGYVPEWNAVVEAKIVNSFQAKQWDGSLRDGIPLKYLIQIAKQCHLKNADKGFAVVNIGNMDYKEFSYERDLTLEKLIIDSDLEFWDKVQKKIEPDPICIADCKMMYQAANSDQIMPITYSIQLAFNGLIEVKEKIKQLEEHEEKFKMTIMKHMKNAEFLIDQQGEVLASWKSNKKGTRVFTIRR